METDCPSDCGGCACHSHPPCYHCIEHTFDPVMCVMCKENFRKEDLDFLERCEPCFRLYLDMEDKPHVGVPFVPIYNGGRK